MTYLRFTFLLLVAATFTSGCSKPDSTVVVDERSEAEIKQELEDYDKQQAAAAADYEKQNGN